MYPQGYCNTRFAYFTFALARGVLSMCLPCTEDVGLASPPRLTIVKFQQEHVPINRNHLAIQFNSSGVYLPCAGMLTENERDRTTLLYLCLKPAVKFRLALRELTRRSFSSSGSRHYRNPFVSELQPVVGIELEREERLKFPPLRSDRKDSRPDRGKSLAKSQNPVKQAVLSPFAGLRRPRGRLSQVRSEWTGESHREGRATLRFSPVHPLHHPKVMKLRRVGIGRAIRDKVGGSGHDAE
jgi:hypothetical protein